MRKILILILAAFALVGCGEDKAQTDNQTKVHEHTFSNQWTYNELTHWHKATCGHDELTSNFGNHKFNSFGICTVCNYKNPNHDPYADLSTTIYFDSDGGSSIEPFTIKYNQTVNLPVSEKEGFTFEGWNLNGKPFVLDTSDPLIFSSDLHLIANWRANNNEVVLYRDQMLGHAIFDYNDGRGVFKEYDLEENGEFIDFPYPNRINKEFIGWSLDQNVDFYVTHQTPIRLYGCSGNRYKYKGIDTSGDQKENSFVRENLHFYAIWNETVGGNSVELNYGSINPEGYLYDFTVDGSYNSTKLEIQGNFDGNIYVLEEEYYDYGYKFKTIATLDCDRKYEINVEKFCETSTSNMYQNRRFRLKTINAKKKLNEIDVCVKAFSTWKSSFNFISSSTSRLFVDGYSVSIKTNQDFTLPIDYFSSYDFAGYYTEKNGNGIKITDNEGKSNKPWSDLAIHNLYAFYIPKKVSVSFNTGCDEEIEEIEVQFMSAYQLKTPKKTGYKFEGWYLVDIKVLESASSWSYFPTKSIELVAKWTPLLFKISFSEKSSETKNISDNFYYLTVWYNQNITLGYPNSRNGFEFMGWYTGENGTGTRITNKSGHLLENWHFLNDLFVYSYFEPLQ